MFVLFNTIATRVIVVVVTALCFALPKQVLTQYAKGMLYLCGVTIQVEKDTTKAEEERKREKKDREREAVRISITDKGIKIGSEKDEDVIFEFDTEEFREQLEELRETQKLIGESLAAKFEDWEDEGFYYEDRGKDLIRIGERQHISRHERVRGDAVTIFDDILVEGKVMGSVVTVFGDIEIAPSAVINGDVVCVFGTISRDDEANIRGEVVHIGGGTPRVYSIFPLFGKGTFRLVSRIILFVIGVLLLGIVLAFLPDRMKRSSNYVFGSFFKSLGVGALALIVGSVIVGLLAAILSITIIGIPVAVLLVLSFIALCLIGYFVSAFALGRLACAKFNIESDSPFLHGLVGLFLLAVLGLIAGIMYFNPLMYPISSLFKVLSVFVKLLALLVGVGAFVVSKAGSISKEPKPILPE